MYVLHKGVPMHDQGSSQCELKSNYFRLSLLLSLTVTLLIVFFHESLFTNAAGPPSCLTVSAPGSVWKNLPLVSPQAGTFTAEIDATPLAAGMSGGVGLSNGSQTTFAGLACAARFYTDGKIQARNGGGYAAANTIPYSANTTYHFRFVVNVPAHTYSVYVTPSGGNEQIVGLNYAFRPEQATVSSVNNWALFSDIGSMRACGFGAPCYTATAGSGWINNSFTSQSTAFTAEWDATPLAANISAVMALSNGAQNSVTAFACLTRFFTDGKIQARDGGTYNSASPISYTANTTYHFRLVVNVPSHTYSIYVTPAGGSEQLVGLNYTFRTEQSTVSALNNQGLIVDTATGSARLCNFVICPTDKWGITKLNPTISGGREWFSKWDNGQARTFGFAQDPYDLEFHGRGDGTYTIDGQGVLTAFGMGEGGVRMYVYDQNYPTTSGSDITPFKKWNNVEVTVYYMRVNDTNEDFAGMVAAAKINHDNTASDPCGARGYYGRFRHDGGIDFDKEIRHPEPEERPRDTKPWSVLPSNVWIGYKYIVRDVNNGTHVKLELWRDLTDAANGGTWEMLHDEVDTGDWGTGETPRAPGKDPAQIMTGPNLSVFIRDDFVSEVRYKKWSIREIAPQ
jgi:hypothetical protein